MPDNRKPLDILLGTKAPKKPDPTPMEQTRAKIYAPNPLVNAITKNETKKKFDAESAYNAELKRRRTSVKNVPVDTKYGKMIVPQEGYESYTTAQKQAWLIATRKEVEADIDKQQQADGNAVATPTNDPYDPGKLVTEGDVYKDMTNAYLEPQPFFQATNAIGRTDAGKAIVKGARGAASAMTLKTDDPYGQLMLDLTLNATPQLINNLGNILDTNVDNIGKYQSALETYATVVPALQAGKAGKVAFDLAKNAGKPTVKALLEGAKAAAKENIGIAANATSNLAEKVVSNSKRGIDALPIPAGIRARMTPRTNELPFTPRPALMDRNPVVPGQAPNPTVVEPSPELRGRMFNDQQQGVATPSGTKLEDGAFNPIADDLYDEIVSETPVTSYMGGQARAKRAETFTQSLITEIQNRKANLRPRSSDYRRLDILEKEVARAAKSGQVHPMVGDLLDEYDQKMGLSGASQVDTPMATRPAQAQVAQEPTAPTQRPPSFGDATPFGNLLDDAAPTQRPPAPSAMNDLQPISANTDEASRGYGDSTYRAAKEAGMSEDQARSAGLIAYKTAREAERLGLDVPSVVAAKLDEIDPTGKLAQKANDPPVSVTPTAKFPDQWRVTDPSQNQELVDQIYIPGTPVGFIEKQLADLIASGEPLVIPGGPPNAKPFQYYLDKTMEGYNAEASFWYSDLGRLAESALGKDNVEEFAQAWSVFSPQKKPEQNFQEAVAAMLAARRNPDLINRLRSGDESVLPALRQEFHKTGIVSQTGKVGKAFVTNEQIDNVMKALADHEQRKGGFKTRNFEGDSSKVVTGEYRTGSTQDRHQAGFYEYGKDVISGPAEFRWTMAVTNAIAQKLGASSNQTQAAQWFIQKFGKGHGVQGGFKSTEDAIAHLTPAMDAEIKGAAPMWTGDARGTQLSTDTRKFAGDFPISTPGSISEEAGRRNAANVIVESRPSFTLSPEMAGLPDSMQEMLNQKLMDAVFPGGQNRAYNAFDITHRTGAGAGSFEGVVSPNYGISVLGGSMPKANLVGAIEGKLNLQDAVAIIKPDFFEKQGSILATFNPGPLSRADLEILKDRLTKEGLDFTLKPDGEVVIGNFGDNPDFGGIIKGLEGNYGKAKTTGTSGSYLDRTADLPSAGQKNLYETGFGSPDEALSLARDRVVPAGRPDLQRLVRDTLIEPRAAAYEEIAKNAGLDPRPVRSQVEAAGKDILERLGLTQMEQNKLKGLYDQLTNRVTFIKDNADISTAIHENGHVLKEMLLKGDDAPLITKFYGDSADVAGHERFARDLEKYFRTGKAPDKKLAQIFESIKTWMREIYTKGVGGKIDPEVKAIFDRVYGKSDEMTDDFLRGFDSKPQTKPRKTPDAGAAEPASGTVTPPKPHFTDGYEPGGMKDLEPKASTMKDMEPTDAPKTTGLSNASNLSDFEEGLLSNVPEGKGRSAKKIYEENRNRKDYDDVADQVADGAPLTADNAAALLAGRDEYIARVRSAKDVLEKAIEEGADTARVRDLQKKLDTAIEEATKYAEKVQRGKSEWSDIGRVLAQKIQVNRRDEAEVLLEARLRKGADLTDDEVKEVKKTVQDLIKEDKATQADIDRLMNERIANEAEVAATRRIATTPEARAAKQKKLLEDFIRASSGVNAFVNPKVIKQFAKYMYGLIENGARSVDDIIAAAAKDGVKADSEDVYAAMRSQIKQPTLTDLQKEVAKTKRMLMTEAKKADPGFVADAQNKKVKKIEDEIVKLKKQAEDGTLPAPKKRQVDDQIKKLEEDRKKALKEAQDASPEYQASLLEKDKERARARLAELEDRIKRGDYAEASVEKNARRVDAELNKLRQKIRVKESMVDAVIESRRPKTTADWFGNFLNEVKLWNVAGRAFDGFANIARGVDFVATSPTRRIVDRVTAAILKEDMITKGSTVDRTQRILSNSKDRLIADAELIRKGADPAAIKKYGSFAGIGGKSAGLIDVPFKSVYYEWMADAAADYKARQILGKDASKEAVATKREAILANLDEHPDIQLMAEEYSLNQTLNNPNWASKTVGGWKKDASGAGKVAIDEVLGRFSKVITNVATDATDRALGIGIVRGGLKIRNAKKLGKTLTVSERAIINDMINKGFTGIAMTTLGYYMGDKVIGTIKGERGKYIDYGDVEKLGAFIAPFLVGATIRKSLAIKDANEAWALRISTILRLPISSPLASNTKDFLNAVTETSSTQDISKFLARKISNTFIPGGVRDIAERQDAKGRFGLMTGEEVEREKIGKEINPETKKEVQTKNFLQILKGDIQSKTPDVTAFGVNIPSLFGKKQTFSRQTLPIKKSTEDKKKEAADKKKEAKNKKVLEERAAAERWRNGGI